MAEKRKPNAKLRVKQLAFLAAYRQCGNITQAAAAAKVHRLSHYEWLRNEPLYATAFRDAEEEAADWLEAEARRRAVEGVRRLRFHHGRPIIDPGTGRPYVEHEYSDTLLIFLLKGARPAKFRDNAALYIDGKLKQATEPPSLAAWMLEELGRLNLTLESRRELLAAIKSEYGCEPPAEAGRSNDGAGGVDE